jgi:hypothetical protein
MGQKSLDRLKNTIPELPSVGLFGHVKNINLQPIVSGHGLGLSGHLAEDELSVTCVWVRLLAVRTLQKYLDF